MKRWKVSVIVDDDDDPPYDTANELKFDIKSVLNNELPLNVTEITVTEVTE